MATERTVLYWKMEDGPGDGESPDAEDLGPAGSTGQTDEKNR